MGKLATYMMFIGTAILLFHFMGLIENTPNSVFLNLLLNPENLETSSANTKAIATVQAITAIVGAAIIGFLTSSFELAAMVPITIFLLNIGWDILIVFNKILSVNPVLAIVIFGPMLFVYTITIVEFWRGRD